MAEPYKITDEEAQEIITSLAEDGIIATPQQIEDSVRQLIEIVLLAQEEGLIDQADLASSA